MTGIGNQHCPMSLLSKTLLFCGSGTFLLLLLGAQDSFAFSCTGSAIAVGPTKAIVVSRKDLLELGTPTTRKVTRASVHLQHSRSSSLVMRDRSSSYWFSVGDTVQVVQDVFRNNAQSSSNLRGRTGRVVETWEKCDVDPTCCCAEQVDTDMAVRVLFDSENDENDNNNDKTNAAGNDSTSTSTAFYYYFAEEELTKV